MNRRDTLKAMVGATAFATTTGLLGRTSAFAQAKPAFTLPPLGYAFDALEPHIDAQTMQIHHDKHHAAYVTNLNKAVADTELAGKPLEDILRDLKAAPEKARTAVRKTRSGRPARSKATTSR